MSTVRGIPAGYEDDDDYIFGVEQNLYIKVVPNITVAAAINGSDFCSELGTEMENWFASFRELWNSSYKRPPAATTSLKGLFKKEPEPLLLALKFFANCPGCNNLKNKGLPIFILDTICSLCDENPEIGKSCDNNTRMIAFNFVKTCGITSLCRDIMRTYQLKKIKDLLIPKLKDMISQGLIKDAANWAIHLKVTHSFGIFEIVLPLMLQDKFYLAEEYLNVTKEQQLQILEFLDSLIDKHKTVLEKCDETLAKYNYTDIKHNVLNYRVLSKVMLRLSKKYNIDSHITPNLNYAKAISYMQYLFHKFQAGGMSCDAWRELVYDTALTKELQLALVTKIAACGDNNEALYWAKYYKLPSADCPNGIKLQMDEQSVERRNSKDFVDSSLPTTSSAIALKPSKPESSQYLMLALPTEAIILVNERKQFLEMLSYLKDFLLIGFDSEWKPSVCNENIVSILQLATVERVYLLDCLSPQITDDLWKQLGRQIFNNLEILKLGFALYHDLRMLHKSLPLQLNLQTTDSYLDLAELWRRIKYTKAAECLFGQGMIAGESLCALTELCLGKKLDKSNQCSNWANRPLRHDQIVYAALDAHCLLKIYENLSERLQSIGLDIDQIIEEISTSKTGYLASVTNESFGVENGMKNACTKNSNNKVVSATEVRFVCDSMLIGLAQELRKLGINCTEVNKQSKTYKVLKNAKRENRCVLSNNARYDFFSCHLRKDSCIYIPKESCVNQVLHLLSIRRIQITEELLYTRCLHCNGKDFIQATRGEMLTMRFGWEHAESMLKKQNAAPSERPFKWVANESIIISKQTLRGKPIKFNSIKPEVLNSKQRFYICDKCGACTWDGEYNIDKRILHYLTPAARSMTTNEVK